MSLCILITRGVYSLERWVRYSLLLVRKTPSSVFVTILKITATAIENATITINNNNNNNNNDDDVRVVN